MPSIFVCSEGLTLTNKIAMFPGSDCCTDAFIVITPVARLGLCPNRSSSSVLRGVMCFANELELTPAKVHDRTTAKVSICLVMHLW